jgi:PIN domain nuclease of toxin-antitoxin system
VNLLLDTHIFLWLQTEPERLGEQLPLVQDERTVLFLSAASSWEIAVKYQLGKLPLPDAPQRYVPDRMRAIAAQALPVEHHHALGVATLPPLHRDPFDRLLVAQATLEDLTILTADSQVAQYPVSTLVV